MQFKQGKNIKARIRISLFVAVFLVFASCSNKKRFINQNDFIKIKGFNSGKWKKDSLSCDDQRPALVKILISNKQNLIDLNRAQVVDLLGRPNGELKNALGYFVESGTQCLDIKHIDYTGIQTKSLLIEFKNGFVDDIYIIVL